MMDLQHIIAQKKELLVRETFSRQPINKIGFVSPERRYEAPGCCTAAAKVIIIMGKDAGFSWFPNRSVAINSRENRVKPLSNIYKQRLTVSKHATNERIVLVVV